MLKFVVVLYRRPDLSPDAFFTNLRDEHGPLAERIPGLRRYVQNHVLPDPKRKHPGWDAVIELYWDDGPPWKQGGRALKAKPLRTISGRSRISLAVLGPSCRSTSADDSGL